jgi:hypothetical protein
VFDAGSTGTRVSAFTFRRSASDRQLRLTDELWKQVKPGVSSYAEKPKMVAKSIHQLLVIFIFLHLFSNLILISHFVENISGWNKVSS